MISRKQRLPVSVFPRNPQKIISSPFFKLKSDSNALGYNRFSIIISSKVDKRSSRRHLWRRRIGSELLKWPSAGKGRDFLIVVSPNIKDADPEAVRNDLRRVAERMLRA